VLTLLVVGSGFALSRGYLMRFVLNEQTISRDAFYRNAYAPSAKQTTTYCTSGAALGFVYLWEVQCFSTPDALDDFMTGR
jgi:hypothetical protein